MSAPTPAPGDDRPREGYYPDPSIPGYVRYWNGSAWVPGTSRPAPSDGTPLTPPASPVEETGPHFFDEDPNPADQVGGGRPEPASAWGADRAHQSGFGGDQDRRVSWGAPQGADPRALAQPGVPAQQGGPGSPAQPDGWSASTDGTATIPPAEPESGDVASGGTFVFRRPGARDAAGGAAAGNAKPGFGAGKAAAERAAAAQTAQAQSTPGLAGHAAPGLPGPAAPGLAGHAAPGLPGPAAPGLAGHAAPGLPGHAAPGLAGQGTPGLPGHAAPGLAGQAAPGLPGPAAPAQAPGTPGLSASASPAQAQAASGLPGQAASGLPGQAAGAPGLQGPAARMPAQQGPAVQGPAAQASAVPSPAVQPPPAPQPGLAPQGPGAFPPAAGQAAGPVPQSAPGVPQQSAPMAAGPGGGQSSWAQQVHRLAGADEQPPPWKPPVEDIFQAAARRQAAARPAGLGKRFAARLVDTLVLAAVTSAAAVPLGVKALDHVNEKIDEAELTGRTVTVWLLDGTTSVYLGIVLAVLLVFGILYEALPTAKWGRTLGKKLLGLQVRDIEGHEPPAFGAALLRWLVYSVPGLLVIGVVGVVWGAFDRPWRQCWHDKAAHTFVAG
ncbi:RDD family protein [Streptomyces sp. NPDC005811]|uniref:RDD family protein n=1 Tax=Streptomyces sp. NPDC005811 TaxID=3154565 RepID=UPI0033FB3378